MRARDDPIGCFGTSTKTNRAARGALKTLDADLIAGRFTVTTMDATNTWEQVVERDAMFVAQTRDLMGDGRTVATCQEGVLVMDIIAAAEESAAERRTIDTAGEGTVK